MAIRIAVEPGKQRSLLLGFQHRLWSLLILAVAIGVTAVSTGPTTSVSTFMIACILLLVFVLFVLVAGSSSPSHTEVWIYASGLQIPRQRYIPTSQVIDCVVVEVIFATEIRNAVVLRLWKRKPEETLVPDNLELVELFPDVDLTYLECLKLRDRICRALASTKS